MKKSKFAILAFFFFIQIGELILPFSKSTLANNIVEIAEKERNTLSANSYVKEGIKKANMVIIKRQLMLLVRQY